MNSCNGILKLTQITFCWSFARLKLLQFNYFARFTDRREKGPQPHRGFSEAQEAVMKYQMFRMSMQHIVAYCIIKLEPASRLPPVAWMT